MSGANASPDRGVGVDRLVRPTDEEAADFLRTLVETASVSGGESRAVAIFAERAVSWGLGAEIDEAGNGIAVRRGGGGDRRTIVLLGHIDTVPGAIPVRIEDGVLHGRGSVDAKGPLAAMLAAAARADLPESVRVMVVAAVGEETPHSPGARHIAGRLRPDACIIGEPSHWDGVTLGYKGRLVMHAACEAGCGHSAGPQGSAADALLEFWGACRSLAEELNQGRIGAFDSLQCTVQGLRTSSDGLRERAELTGGFRLPPWLPPRELEEHLRRVASGRGGLTLGFLGHEAAHQSDRNDAVARALVGAIRDEGGRPRPRVKTGTSDMNVVAPVWGCPIAAYGPGDSTLDHTAEERIEIAEFHRAVRVLTRALEALSAELVVG